MTFCQVPKLLWAIVGDSVDMLLILCLRKARYVRNIYIQCTVISREGRVGIFEGI